ncbi:hypothetical protein RB195_023178 [Necator americanus]|uniref:Uncharacterized protein n=1 Tax=Necator americanus TaxID=51031 RepID=A0ABR1EKE9_NECAM
MKFLVLIIFRDVARNCREYSLVGGLWLIVKAVGRGRCSSLESDRAYRIKKPTKDPQFHQKLGIWEQKQNYIFISIPFHNYLR